MIVVLPRLNAKVSGRDVAVKNLVTDLSDGVSPIVLAGDLHLCTSAEWTNINLS